jgi:uncharacterized protein YacL
MVKNLLKTHRNHIEKHIQKHITKHLFKQHASTAIIAAFSFLIALSWKDLIVNLVTALTKPLTLEKYPYLADLYSAIIVTIIAIIGIGLVTKWAKKPEVLVSETETN